MLWICTGVEMPRQIEAERATVPRACRAGLRSAGAWGRRRRPQGQQERPEAWRQLGETLALRKEVQALARMARETMAAIEWAMRNGSFCRGEANCALARCDRLGADIGGNGVEKSVIVARSRPPSCVC